MRGVWLHVAAVGLTVSVAGGLWVLPKHVLAPDTTPQALTGSAAIEAHAPVAVQVAPAPAPRLPPPTRRPGGTAPGARRRRRAHAARPRSRHARARPRHAGARPRQAGACPRRAGARPRHAGACPGSPAADPRSGADAASCTRPHAGADPRALPRARARSRSRVAAGPRRDPAGRSSAGARAHADPDAAAGPASGSAADRTARPDPPGDAGRGVLLPPQARRRVADAPAVLTHAAAGPHAAADADAAAHADPDAAPHADPAPRRLRLRRGGRRRRLAHRGPAAGGHNAVMARTPLTKAVGPLGMALTAWDVWRRLSPQQRRWLAAQAKTHGPRLARQAWAAQQERRRQ